MRTVNSRGDDLGRLEIVGDEDPGRQAGTGGLRRHRIREVAGRGAADGIKAECPGRVNGDGDYPVLEGKRWVRNPVVLEPGAGHAQPTSQGGSLDQRRETAVER